MERAAGAQGLAASQLELVNAVQASYPIQQITAYNFKFMDAREGTLYGLMLDEFGHELDAERLAADELAANEAIYGLLEPDLAEKLLLAPEDEPIRVLIWLKEEPFVAPPAPVVGEQTTAEDLDTYLRGLDALRAEAVEAVVAPVADDLAKLGYTVEVSEYAPLLTAALTPEAVREVADWPEVARIFLWRAPEPELHYARPAIRADVVHSRGFMGTGVSVAQVEMGGRVATGNPNFLALTHDTTNVCGSASDHSTAVAGIIASTHNTERGIAPAVNLWAGGSCDGTQLNAAANRAVAWGARVLNLSWGSDTNRQLGGDDRFYDQLVFTNRRTVVKSAGNRGTWGWGWACGDSNGDGDVTSPGLAYNVITVANFDDGNSGDWGNDTINSCSSWRDPVSVNGDREKPELAAPGTNIWATTTGWPWTGLVGDGTSFAAPMVTGTAALMIQRNTNLTARPEAIKAILMVTAVNNIEGSERLSEKDGSGGIDAARADEVARNVNGGWGETAYSCTGSSARDVATIYLLGNKRARVAIVWPTDPADGGYFLSQPCADLDLQVISPSGSAAASSTSFDNTYEIVDFTTSTSGNYRIRVLRFRCGASPQRLAWAWRQTQN